MGITKAAQSEDGAKGRVEGVKELSMMDLRKR